MEKRWTAENAMQACWNGAMVEMSNGELITEQEYRDGYENQKDGYATPFEHLRPCRDDEPKNDETENDLGF